MLMVSVQPVPDVVFLESVKWQEYTLVVHVDCQIREAKPTVNTVRLTGHNSITPDSGTNTTLNSDGKTYRSSWRYMLKLDWKEDFETRLQCIASWNGQEILSEERNVTDVRCKFVYASFMLKLLVFQFN